MSDRRVGIFLFQALEFLRAMVSSLSFFPATGASVDALRIAEGGEKDNRPDIGS